jgi:hypothetical protein
MKHFAIKTIFEFEWKNCSDGTIQVLDRDKILANIKIKELINKYSKLVQFIKMDTNIFLWQDLYEEDKKVIFSICFESDKGLYYIDLKLKKNEIVTKLVKEH